MLEALLSGYEWFHLGFSADELRDAWRDYGVDLMRRWLKAYPGRRPWAWWRYVAKSPRESLEAIDIPAGRPLRFGIPAGLDPGLFETEAFYLERLGLLTPAEKKALLKGAPVEAVGWPDIGLEALQPIGIWARPREIP